MKVEIVNRLSLFRRELENNGISWYIVPTDDFHMSEYVGDYFKEREFLSGFDGSYGTLLISKDSAYLWTDGRYFLAATEMLKDTGISLMKMGEVGVPTIIEFLKERMCEGEILGYYGRTMSYSFGKELRENLPGIIFKTDLDLVDLVWENRPKLSAEKIWKLDEEYSGKSIKDKIEELRLEIKKENAYGMLITSLDEIAWLLNIRGNDVLYTPVCLSYVIVLEQAIVLYIQGEALDNDSINYLVNNGITLRKYFEIYNDISKVDKEVLVDPVSTNESLFNLIPLPKVTNSPIKKMKAIKNITEIRNERLAHIKDGVSLTKTIYWLKKKVEDKSIYSEDELSVEKHLTDLRKENSNFISLSFDSIVATGDHSPIVHYEPTSETNTNIKEGFLLLDTGAQYLEGTTDVTRTVSIGNISREMRLHYTTVLKGHIDLALAKFPKGVTGGQLDIYARRPLWNLGLDYNHGTGHGVGYLLGVHEGPQSIRKQNMVPLELNMITSDEPGLYLTGKYGIRIENLFLTIPTRYENYYGFDMLTMVPYDKDSIDLFLLDDEELIYLRKYSDRVYDTISPYLDEEEKTWLREETTF